MPESIVDPRKLANSRSAARRPAHPQIPPSGGWTITYSPSACVGMRRRRARPPASPAPRHTTPRPRHPLTVRHGPDSRLPPTCGRASRVHADLRRGRVFYRGARLGTGSSEIFQRISRAFVGLSKASLSRAFTNCQELDSGLATRLTPVIASHIELQYMPDFFIGRGIAIWKIRLAYCSRIGSAVGSGQSMERVVPGG
jgi:hypothetical protein